MLRAVNVGDHGRVSMLDLSNLVVRLGYGDVRTVLNSGNVIFSAEPQSSADIEARLEKEAAAQLNLRTEFLVRSLDELAAVVAGNTFSAEAEKDPSHVLVMFLKSAPPAAAVESLRAAMRGREAIQAHGPHLYATYPDGIGRSRLTTALIESKLGTRGTGRNWNTVLKLLSLRAATAAKNP